MQIIDKLKIIPETVASTAKNLPTPLVILIAMLLPCTAAVPLPKLAVPNGFGVNIHFTGQPKDLDLIADAGFKFIRMDLNWSSIERKKGVYDFTKAGYDALTTGCIKRGIRILYILDYSNRLYEPDGSVRTEQGRKAFAAFAEAAAKRYKGKGILWEIWNEPNIKQFWSPQPSVRNYCKLVQITAPRIKKADPSGLVIAPAASGIPLPWLQQCFKKGLLAHLDAVSVHPYRAKPPETVIADYQKLRKMIQKYAPEGKKIPIISGEWGYSNVNWNKTRLSNQQQAQYLVREFLINLYRGIPLSIWYDWKNDGTNPAEREHNFGIVTHDLKPKQAYMAARILAFTLDGFSIKRRLNLKSENDFAFLLTKDKRKAIAIWTTEQEHQVTLPVKNTATIVINFLGNEVSIPPNACKNGKLNLKFSQSPQYLLLP